MSPVITANEVVNVTKFNPLSPLIILLAYSMFGFMYTQFARGWNGDAVVSTSAPHSEGAVLTSQPGPFCVESVCFPHIPEALNVSLLGTLNCTPPLPS